jgi:S1 RNA binding domain protein
MEPGRAIRPDSSSERSAGRQHECRDRGDRPGHRRSDRTLRSLHQARVGRDGLVHISEIDRNYVRSVEEHLRIDDQVTVKVVGVKEDGKIDLSIKQAAPTGSPRQPPRRAAKDPEFEQKLKRFMRSSEERLVDVKRQREGRRG